MKIALLGANGRTGRCVIQQALEAGDTVTALVRREDSLSDLRHARLEVHTGDVCSPAFLTPLLTGQEAVISTLGPRSPMKLACNVYPESAAAIVAAMQATGVQRLAVTSTALLFKPRTVTDHLLRLLARNNVTAALAMEAIINASDLDWSVARAGFLTDSDTRGFEAIADSLPAGGRSVTRQALAAFLLCAVRHAGDNRGVFGLRAVPLQQQAPEAA